MMLNNSSCRGAGLGDSSLSLWTHTRHTEHLWDLHLTFIKNCAEISAAHFLHLPCSAEWDQKTPPHTPPKCSTVRSITLITLELHSLRFMKTGRAGSISLGDMQQFVQQRQGASNIKYWQRREIKQWSVLSDRNDEDEATQIIAYFASCLWSTHQKVGGSISGSFSLRVQVSLAKILSPECVSVCVCVNAAMCRKVLWVVGRLEALYINAVH